MLFLQGEFQEKLNKLESESENEGGSRHFVKLEKEESAKCTDVMTAFTILAMFVYDKI